MTQSTDVFRSMTAEECEAFVRELRDETRPLYKEIESVAAETLRLRPVFLRKQPFQKRCAMIRKAMALKVNAEEAAEILAAFFVECHPDKLEELLDELKLEHDGGVLEETNPSPPEESLLRKVVEKFREGEDPLVRSLLLRAFAAQPAIDWPVLDEIVFPREQEAPIAG